MINFIQFTITRALLACLTLFLVSLIVFSLMEIVPANCAERYLAFKNTQGSNITVEDIAAEEKKLGLAAKERNKELLEKVSSKSGYFRLKSYGVGKYGRVLGEIFIMDVNENTICINNQLITEGHAYVYDGGKKKLLKEVKNG